VSIPSYSGTVEQPNLMPALALLLARFGVPVLVHGPLEAQGRVAGAAVLRDLGVLPCASLHQARDALAGAGVAFVPTALLSPALAQLIALRGRLGVANCAQLIARLLDPFAGGALLLAPASDAIERAALAGALEGAAACALLFVGAEGEAFAARSSARPSNCSAPASGACCSRRKPLLPGRYRVRRLMPTLEPLRAGSPKRWRARCRFPRRYPTCWPAASTVRTTATTLIRPRPSSPCAPTRSLPPRQATAHLASAPPVGFVTLGQFSRRWRHSCACGVRPFRGTRIGQ
jgi:hypothetical protein